LCSLAHHLKFCCPDETAHAAVSLIAVGNNMFASAGLPWQGSSNTATGHIDGMQAGRSPASGTMVLQDKIKSLARGLMMGKRKAVPLPNSC
jgi:hypothetical protein